MRKFLAVLLSLILALSVITVVPISASAAPADFKGFTAVANTDLIYNYDGYMTTDWDDELLQPTPEYFKYEVWTDNFDYYIEYTDGSVRIFSGNELLMEYNGDPSFDFSVNDPQEYNAQWGLGKHDVEITVFDKTYTAQIEVVKNPIKSISATAKEGLIENFDGYMHSDWYPETDTNSPEYFRYDLYDCFIFNVTLQDGTKFECSESELSEYFDNKYWVQTEPNQNYENQWKLGQHSVDFEFIGHKFTARIDVVKNPIKSISATAKKDLIENCDGYMHSDWDWETDTNSPEYFRYDLYDCFIFNVTLQDGTKFECSQSELQEYFNDEYWLNAQDDQSYENQWKLGQHSVDFEFLGNKFTARIDVVKTPVKSIVAKPYRDFYDTFDKGTLWDEENETEFDGYWIYENAFEYTVTFTNGSVFTGNYNELWEEFGYYPELSNNQSVDNQWSYGKHNIQVSFMGKTDTGTVNIVKSPYKGIKISDTNGFKVQFIKNDGSLQDVAVYSFTMTAGGMNTVSGFMETDLGNFFASFLYYAEAGEYTEVIDITKDIQLVIGSLKSNILAQNDILAALITGEDLHNVAAYYQEVLGKPFIYNKGSYKLDDIVMITAAAAYLVGWDTVSEAEDGKFYGYTDATLLKEAIKELFGLNVDITKATGYDAETNMVYVLALNYMGSFYNEKVPLPTFANNVWTYTDDFFNDAKIIITMDDTSGIIGINISCNSHKFGAYTKVDSKLQKRTCSVCGGVEYKNTVTAANGTNGALVQWNKIPTATKYYIYKSTYSGGVWSNYKYVGSSTGLSYTDAAVSDGQYVKYKLRAVNGDETVGYGDPTATLRRLSNPKVTAENKANGIYVQWNKINGAQKYYVYKSVYTDGKWSDWKYTKGTTITSFTDTSVKDNEYVRYMVRALDRSYISSYAKVADIRRLSSPTVTTSNITAGVNVKWNKITGAQKYYVYKRTLVNGEWTAWKYYKGVTSATSVTDTALASGTYVQYQVRAVNGDDTSAYGVTTTQKRLANPKATLAKTTSGIKLTWGKVSGAQKYYVYRSEYRNGKWTDWTYAKGTTGTTVTDTAAPKGVTVKYYVRAIDRTYMSSYVPTATIRR